LFGQLSAKSEEKKASGILAAVGIKGIGALLVLTGAVALARTGVIVANYGGYNQTDSGLLTDGSTLVCVLILWALAFALVFSKRHLTDRQLTGLMIINVALETLCLLVLALLVNQGLNSPVVFAFCSVIMALSGQTTLLFWLRQMHLSNTAVAVIVIFLAMAASEPLIYLCSQFEDGFANVAAALCTVAQLPLILILRRGRIREQHRQLQSFEGFSLERRLLFDRRLLITVFAAFSLIAVAVGMLRGYPAGSPIPFTDSARVIYMILTILITLTVVALSLRLHFWALLVTIWVALQVLICLALVATAALPLHLEIGAIFTTTANAFLAAFVAYFTVLMMASFKKYDPYVYAIAMTTGWIFSRAISRLLILDSLDSLPFTENGILIVSLAAILLVVSSQAFFMRFFISLMPKPALPFMGTLEALEEQDRTAKYTQQPDERRPRLPIRRGVQEIGERFLLTEREVEVLTLYSQGFTQRRVAEELFISKETAHAHIKNIYQKTNLHSRLEVLDYIEKYTSVVGPASDLMTSERDVWKGEPRLGSA
jgi:DNA-binding CsgD family transcriptional regulator